MWGILHDVALPSSLRSSHQLHFEYTEPLLASSPLNSFSSVLLGIIKKDLRDLKLTCDNLIYDMVGEYSPWWFN